MTPCLKEEVQENTFKEATFDFNDSSNGFDFNDNSFGDFESNQPAQKKDEFDFGSEKFTFDSSDFGDFK